ncbi:MAG: carbohydrate kinase family protein [Candidatus Hydrothermarchaeales archaeon]
MDVATLGHVSIDTVRTDEGEKNQLGGAAVYSAMASKVFGKTGIVSRVGMDFPPKNYKVLKDAGIITSGIKRIRGKSTRFTITYDKQGNANYGDYKVGVGAHIRPKDIPPDYMKAKAFHIAPTAPSKQKRVIKHLRKNFYGIVSLNTHIGYFKKYRKSLSDLIKDVDIFTLNDEEATFLTGSRRFEQSLRQFKKIKHNIVIITLGVIGSAIIENDEVNFFPSVVQPKIVDLTGCGDAFAGAFVASYLKTQNSTKSANIANSIASIAATDWNFSALKNMKYKNLEKFQLFVIARQRQLAKNQRNIEHFLR